MTQCGCEQCRAEPWPTYTRQFFHECEVCTIARWPLEARREHLVKVEKARGLEAANRLREGLTELFAERKKENHERQ
jgi:hypothetical protein